MDPALLLLLKLRFWGFLRRAGRKMGTARGLLLTALGFSIFLPSIVGTLIAPVPPRMAAGQVEGFRRIGPIFLLAYCLLTLLFSPGDKAFAFSPAEVSFLFPAPFSRRKLLAYKIGGNIGLVFLSAIFMTFAFRQNSPIWFAGYLGLVLAFAFLQLFAMAVTLAGQAIGARASTRRRQLALGLIVALAGATVLSVGLNALQNFNLKTLMALEKAPAVRVALAPFRPFIRTISAERIWPDLFLWGGIGLAINALLIGVILSLDAQYLEAAAASSERLYAKLERMRKGGPSVSARNRNKKWKELPALPWWGGLGPILWRQLTTAGRDYARAMVPFVIAFTMAGLGIFLAGKEPDPMAGGGGAVSLMFAGLILSLSVLLSPLLGFDFRGDFERMEGLKTLPITSWRLALGQLATPVVLLTISQALALLILASATWPVQPAFWAIAAFAMPLNVVLLEIDNLMFLWFPSRPMAHTPGDIQAMGRVMLMMMAKMFVLAIAAGIASLFGFLAWLLAGWIATVAVAWLVLAGLAVLFVPVIAAAFRRFDVASETPG